MLSCETEVRDPSASACVIRLVRRLSVPIIMVITRSQSAVSSYYSHSNTARD